LIDRNTELRERSGCFNSYDPLTGLFYMLLRDGYISPAISEELIRSEEDHMNDEKIYSNGWLAKYAQDLSDRLKVEDK